MRKSRKRAQAEAIGAATLIALIAGFIVLYILFLPASERDKILNDSYVYDGNNSVNDDVVDDTSEFNESLLVVYPGSIDYVSARAQEYDINTISLSSAPKPKMIYSTNTIFVEKGLFSKKTEKITFKIEDPSEAENLQLTFNVEKAEGRLMITLNGQDIFNKNIRSVQPVIIPTSALNENNELEFTVSSPGIVFWATNQYILEKIQISGELIEKEKLEGSSTFWVSRSSSNIEKATLLMVPECQGSAEKLTITVNKNEIFSAIPECGSVLDLVFAPHYIREGENTITFKTEKGIFLLDTIRIHTSIEEQLYPTYYIQLSEAELDKATDDADTYLNITFIDNDQYKKAQIIFNNRIIPIDQKDPVFSQKVNKYLQAGNNAIELVPQTDLDIIELTVYVEG